MILENYNKKMPFIENEGYVENLLQNVVEYAIMHQRSNSRSSLKFVGRIAASFILLVGISIMCYFYFLQNTATSVAQIEQLDSLEQFLGTISEEEVDFIEYYEIEELTFQYE